MIEFYLFRLELSQSHFSFPKGKESPAFELELDARIPINITLWWANLSFDIFCIKTWVLNDFCKVAERWRAIKSIDLNLMLFVELMISLLSFLSFNFKLTLVQYLRFLFKLWVRVMELPSLLIGTILLSFLSNDVPFKFLVGMVWMSVQRGALFEELENVDHSSLINYSYIYDYKFICYQTSSKTLGHWQQWEFSHVSYYSYWKHTW